MYKKIDRRIKISFHTLDERQEIIISSDLVDYIIWYNNNKNSVNEIILMSDKEINNKSIVKFWINNVGKCAQIEKFLNDHNVIIDTYNFVEKYLYKFIILKKEPERQVFSKEAFRTEEQANRLREIFEKYPSNPKVKQIKLFLLKHKMDVDHINKDFAIQSINTCLKYIN